MVQPPGVLRRGWIFWVFISLTILAAGLRLRVYLMDSSLNHDEAALAVNLIHRGFFGLLKGLDFGQVAPVGFLWLEKVIGQMTGYSEMGLRLVPFLAGIALVPVFMLVAGKCFDWPTAFVGGLLLGTERRLIDWAARVKPYGLDALLAIITFYLIYRAVRRRWDARSWIMVAIWGVVAQWFSFPMILLLAGMIGAAIVLAAVERKWALITPLLGLCALWAVSFLIDHHLAMKTGGAAAHLELYWNEYFMPHGIRALVWIPWALAMIFSSCIRLGPWPGLPLLVLIGACLLLWRDRRNIVLLVVCPIVPALIAAALGQYPFGNRLVLYLVPLLVLLISGGLLRLWRIGGDRLRWAAPVLLLALVAMNIGSAAIALYRPHLSDETRPAWVYIRKNAAPTDQIYVGFYAQPSYDYYATRLHLTRWIAHRASGITDQQIQSDFKSLRGRTWFISDLLNVRSIDDAYQRLLAVAGSRGSFIRRYRATHVAVDLYNLRDPAATTWPAAAQRTFSARP